MQKDKKKLESKIQLSKLLQVEKKFSPQIFRIGIILALLIYGTFGYLDFYAMPSNYTDSWLIRYVIIAPLLVVVFLSSYSKPLFRYRKTILFLLLISGQFGILYMIGISVPGDMAYYSYYAGLILVMLWACFVFRVNFITTVFIAVSTVLFYNLTAIYYQKILSFPFGSNPWLILLNNNYFLVAAAVLAIIGAYLIERQDKEIRRVHNELVIEKRELELARDKAEESDRLKSAFLANMSHEIRTPLNSIIGFSELITDPYFDHEQHLEFAGLINQSGKNLLSVLTNIMDISKIEAGQLELKMTRFSITSVLLTVQREYLLSAKNRGIDLVLNSLGTEREVFIISDEAKFRQILVNLIDNSMKFTSEGFIELGVTKNENKIEIWVKDTGIGIPKDHHDKIFERFRQVETSNTRKYGGNGLGLAISKGLVEMLGGEIWLESEQGKGTSFYFSLPILQNS
jgi:signal transduction histidine kinase